MILTLCFSSQTIHLNITPKQLMRLRDPMATAEEISAIAFHCGVDYKLLKAYADDIQHSLSDTIDMDGSCDYSDHL